jgi:hypothetical protein
MSTLDPNPNPVVATTPADQIDQNEDRPDVAVLDAAAEPAELTDDRVLALRPARWNATTPRLPNQHDMLNVDDDELFRRPTFEDAAWIDNEGGRFA